MAKSPVGDIFEGIQKFLGGIHTVDWLIRIVTGQAMPDDAPPAAKVASGFLRSGDEVVLQILLEELAKEDKRNKTNHRENIINFLYWLRSRGKGETAISSFATWYYFNGFRIKVAKMHEASKSTKKETFTATDGAKKAGRTEKKGGSGTVTVETQTYSRTNDGGLMFLRRISQIIDEYKVVVGSKAVVESSGATNMVPEYDYVPGYEEAIKFIKVSGVPVMPDLTAMYELQERLISAIPEVVEGVKARYEKWETGYAQKHDERVQKLPGFVKWMLDNLS